MPKSCELGEIAERFAEVAVQFCNVVDAVSSLERDNFVRQIYGLLPKVIDQVISFPDVTLTNDEADEHQLIVDAPAKTSSQDIAQWRDDWQHRYSSLVEKLGNWDPYREVFDPINGTEIIYGSLADDLADTYRDLTQTLNETSMPPEDRIWAWQFSFRTHWGHHAVDALRTIHSLLHYQ